MNLNILLSRGLKTVKRNSPEIMTGLGVAGVLTTSYLTGKASYEAAEVLRGTDTPSDRTERIKTQVKHTWRLYIPAGVSGALTIGCIIGASKSNAQRTTAAVAAYSLTEKAFSDYREKVVEQIGKTKEQGIRDSIAQDKLDANPVGSKEVVIIGGGHVLCCELYTNRYFRSDVETLRKAENTINKKLLNELYVSLDEFYYILGLQSTTESANMGWDSDILLELRFTSALAENSEPCLAFEYNYVKPLR